MSVLILRKPAPVALTALAQAANQLAAGQCIRLPITITAGQVLDDGAPITKWGSSACWDPNAREVLYVGKRQDASHAYKFLTYHEDTNACDLARDPANTANVSGHGYDHNAINPATGEFFYREFNDLTVHRWFGGEWDDLPVIPAAVSHASSLTYVPGVGLLTVDPVRIRRYNGSAWDVLKTLGGADANHSVSEYNPNSNELVFGGGNNGDALSIMDCATLEVSAVDTPPFNVGSGGDGTDLQGVIVTDPSGNGWITCEKGTGNWAYLDSDGSWTTLTQSSGDGSSAQTGLPNLLASNTDAGLSRIAAPISTYGVTWWHEYVGGADVAKIWLYRHS